MFKNFTDTAKIGSLLRKIIVNPKNHKGQAGKVCIIGGSLEYTGAPYYAGVSALKTGSDLAYIICHKDAAIPIKSYHPELIVIPQWDNDKHYNSFDFKRANSVVIGPGLGRQDILPQMINTVISNIKNVNIPIVLDGDALFYLSCDENIVKDYSKFILTPNFNEFKRIYESYYHEDIIPYGLEKEKSIEKVEKLSKRLNNITIVLKGAEDIITNGKHTVCFTAEKSPRRCGGQGDILAGMIGFFSQLIDRNYKDEISEYGYISACYLACSMICQAQLFAFKEFDCSTLADDIINSIYKIYKA